MSLQFFTPEQEAALEEVSAAFQRLGETIKEFVDNIARDFKELMEFIEIPEREKIHSLPKNRLFAASANSR